MQSRSSLAAWYALGALSVALLYAMIDRQVLMLLAQPVKASLHLSDTQIGSLQGLGAALFSAIAVVPLGWLADKVDRRLVLAGCILVWSAAIAACGLATGYWSLLLFFSLLAAGESGLSPIVFSMIPELFPERQRMTANFIYYTATLLGAGAGLAIAGGVIDHIGVVAAWLPDTLFARETWRLVFFVVAVPGPLLALAILLIRLKPREPHARAPLHTPEPAPAPQDRPKILGYLAAHWKAIVGFFAPYGLAILGASAVMTWLPLTLTRRFGLSAGEIGAGLGAAIAIGSVGGLALAAVSANFLKKRWGEVTPIRLPQFGYLIFGLLAPLYLVARSPTEFFLIATVQMAATTGASSLSPTVVQNLAPASLRGRVFAIATVIATLFGVVSPIAVGLFSDHVFTGPGGLLLASVVVGAPCLLLAAVTLRLAETHILQTVEAVRALSADA